MNEWSDAEVVVEEGESDKGAERCEVYQSRGEEIVFTNEQQEFQKRLERVRRVTSTRS